MKTQIKITVYNGNTKLRLAYESKDGINVETAKDFIFDGLNSIIEKQQRLKELGAKSNFFGFSETKENFIDIDVVKGDEVETFASQISFRFSHLKNVSNENKKEAFGIILENGFNKNVQIEKI